MFGSWGSLGLRGMVTLFSLVANGIPKSLIQFSSALVIIQDPLPYITDGKSYTLIIFSDKSMISFFQDIFQIFRIVHGNSYTSSYFSW